MADDYKDLIDALILGSKAERMAGDLPPRAFLMVSTPDGPKVRGMMIMDFSSDKAKAQSLYAVGVICKAQNFPATIIVLDIAMRQARTPEEAQYIMQNWDTESPIACPENVRDDAIMVLHIDVVKNLGSIYTCKYCRSPEGFAFQDIKDIVPVHPSAPIGLHEVVMAGYNHKASASHGQN